VGDGEKATRHTSRGGAGKIPKRKEIVPRPQREGKVSAGEGPTVKGTKSGTCTSAGGKIQRGPGNRGRGRGEKDA